MPLRTSANGDASAVTVTTLVNGDNGAYLIAGKQPCIGVQLVNRAVRTDGSGTYVPAHIRLFEHRGISSNRRHCEGAKQREQSHSNFRNPVIAELPSLRKFRHCEE